MTEAVAFAAGAGDFLAAANPEYPANARQAATRDAPTKRVRTDMETPFENARERALAWYATSKM
jgi:hypothetical protein